MNQEHRVDYDVVKRACDDIAFEMNLPMDRFAVRTRDNYIKAIYNSCYQCVTPYNEMAYKWVNSTINGNLASWYANEYSVYKNAPMEWQKDAKETIVEMFKEAYPEREDLKEDYEEYGLPTSFSVLLSDAEKAEMVDSEDEQEFVSDYITNKYGFCHNGFTYEIVGDELIVSDVQWDIDEEDDYELDENLTKDSISGDTLMQEVYDFIISESNEDRLVPFDVVRNMMNERGLRLEDYFNDLLIRDGQEGLLLKTIDGDQYIGPVSLLDKRSEEVAIVKKEEQKLERSVNRLQDKIDCEIAAERKWLEDATYGDIDELVDNVKYIYVEAPRARKYQPLIRKLFGQDADKVHITKSDNPNAKWSISADIYIKDVDKLPAALKAKVNSNGTISSIGLAVELYRAGAKLSGSKEVKESFGAHLLKEAKDPVQRRYKSMSKAKWASLGETMTLKDALDLWWNSVRIDGEIYYKTHTGNYETPEDDIPEELLNRKITLWNEYDNDSDGYPIVYADWSEGLKEAKDIKDKMYVGIWDDAKDDFVEYEEFDDFQDALEFASKYDYSKIKSGTVKFDTNSLFTKGFASEFDIVNGKTDLKAMQELMPKKDIEENFLSEAISSKDITDWCDTSEQEETLKLINRISKRENVSLRLGTKVGKYPQSLIIDHDHQDNAIRIYPNGACIIKDKKFGDWRLDDFDIYEFKNDITNAIKEMVTKKNNNSYVCKLVLMNSDIEEINNLLGSTARMQNWDTDQVVCDEECVFEDGTIGRLLVEIGEDEDETIKGVFELSTGDRKYISDEIDKMHIIELNNYGKSYAISIDGGLSGDYYQNKKERESSKKLFGKKQVNESLQLTEGHDVQEYKGFDLDLDTDLTNHNWEDEEYIITPTVEIKYNGKVLATANGYRAARAWVDKYIQPHINNIKNISFNDFTLFDQDVCDYFVLSNQGIVDSVNFLKNLSTNDYIEKSSNVISKFSQMGSTSSIWMSLDTSLEEFDPQKKGDTHYSILCFVLFDNFSGYQDGVEESIDVLADVVEATAESDGFLEIDYKDAQTVANINKAIKNFGKWFIDAVFNSNSQIEEKLIQSSLKQELTEGYNTQEYKGFTIDLNDDAMDYLDMEEGEIRPTDLITDIVAPNGKVVAHEKGFRRSREWIDKHTEIRELTNEEKLVVLADILKKDKNLDVWFEDADYLCIDRHDLMDSYYLSDFLIRTDDEGYDLTIGATDIVDTILANRGITTEVMKKELGYSYTLSDTDIDSISEDEVKFDYVMTIDSFTETFNDIDRLIEAMSNLGLTKSITEQDIKLLGNNNLIYIDGKALKESYDDWEESGIYGGDLTYCPICDTRLKYDEDGDHYCPKCKEDAHSLSMKRRHLMKESKVSPLDRAVEIYTTVLDPHGNLNSPFDNEEDYIEDLKDSLKNKQYAEYFISEYEDDDDVKAQEFVSLLKNIHSIKEAVDPTRAKEVKENSDAWAVLYGYKFRNEPEVELEPEEHDEKSLRERINEIVSSYNGKGNRPSKNAKETDFIFYVLYR